MGVGGKERAAVLNALNAQVIGNVALLVPMP